MSKPETRTLSFREALREAMVEEMERDPNIFLMGEEVGYYNGAYKVSEGMLEKFGEKRVIDTPIAEAGFAGVGIGAAMVGMRPIIEFMTWNFSLVAYDQLVNNAAKLRYMTNGQFTLPIVFRGPSGAAHALGAQHSQALESIYAHVPGLKVVVPSIPADGKGLLKAAIRDDNPVMFVEHRLLYPTEAYVPEDQYELKPGQSRVVMPGGDVTLVGVSNMLVECLRARELLADVGVTAEVIDPIWLSPLDTDPIVKSVRKTRRLVVVDNGWTMCGAGAEIAARVAEAMGADGKAFQVERLGFAPTICPTSPTIEELFYPNPARIAQAAYRLARPKAPEWTPDPDRAVLAYQKQFRGPF